MSIPKTYYWKDRKGVVKTSKGIELTQAEKQALCRKNLRRIDECHHQKEKG